MGTKTRRVLGHLGRNGLPLAFSQGYCCTSGSSITTVVCHLLSFFAEQEATLQAMRPSTNIQPRKYLPSLVPSRSLMRLSTWILTLQCSILRFLSAKDFKQRVLPFGSVAFRHGFSQSISRFLLHIMCRCNCLSRRSGPSMSISALARFSLFWGGEYLSTSRWTLTVFARYWVSS